MLSRNVYYQEEKKYVKGRLTFLIIITFFSFAITTEMLSSVRFVRLVLGGLVVISMFQYALVVRYPYQFISYRKNALIFLDLIVLTSLVAIFGKYGLYLLPLYIIIVMQSGLSLGIEYFYTSVISAAFSWIVLLKYSEYWQMHYDIIATFAMTALLIPLFYLSVIMRVHDQNDELSDMLTATEHYANFDALTGIANRKMYNEVIKNTLKEKEFFALLFIDLDKFKAINDTYGHEIGDHVLKEVTRRLLQSISSEDFLARLGGDEFVIISKRRKVFLPKFLESLVSKTVGEHNVEDINVLIELSIGVSLYPDDGQSKSILGQYADEAMYVAKRKHNTYHMFYSDIKS